MFEKMAKISLLPVATSLIIGSLLINFTSNTREVEPRQNILEENEQSARLEEPLANYDITAVDTEKSFASETESFLFCSSVPIDYIGEEGNVDLVGFEYSDGEVYCVLTNFDDDSYVILSFYRNGEIIDRCALYFAESSDGLIYSSAISSDTACRNAGQELNYDLSYEIDEESMEPVNLTNITPYGIGASGRIYGTLRWADEQGNIHPLIGARVRATMSMSWWEAETYTDNNGYYEIDYSDVWHLFGGIPMIHIYTENDNVKVHNEGTYTKTYEFSSGSGGEFSYTFSPVIDGDMGKAMMVFQGIKNFSDYAAELNGGVPIDFCNVKYPVDAEGSSYGNGTIYLSSKPPLTSDLPQTYAAWDVLGHEYGHHVQKCL